MAAGVEDAAAAAVMARARASFLSRQSVPKWPFLPQNRQHPSLRRWALTSGFSVPSLPRYLDQGLSALSPEGVPEPGLRFLFRLEPALLLLLGVVEVEVALEPEPGC